MDQPRTISLIQGQFSSKLKDKNQSWIFYPKHKTLQSDLTEKKDAENDLFSKNCIINIMIPLK